MSTTMGDRCDTRSKGSVGTSMRRKGSTGRSTPARRATLPAQFGEQRGGALAEDFVELAGMRGARALQVLDGDLQREQGILQLVREAAGELAPGGHALGLHQAVALLQQLAGHLVESGGQRADLAR